MILKYEKTSSGELKEGDLFVNAKPKEMDKLVAENYGVAVYVRTAVPINDDYDKIATVYKIIIEN